MTLSSRYFQSYTKMVSTRFEVVSLSGSGVTGEITLMRQHHQVLQAVQGLCVNSFLNSFSSCRWGQIFLLPDGALLHFKTTKSLQQDNWFHPGCFIHFFMSCNHGQANHCRPVIQGFLCVDCFYLLIYYKYTYLDEIQVINWVYCATPIVHANDRSPNFTNSCKESTLQSNWPDVRESKSCVTQKTSSAIVSVNVDGLTFQDSLWFPPKRHPPEMDSEDLFFAPFESSEKLLRWCFFLPSKPRLKPGQNLNFTRLKDAWLTVLVGEVCEGRSSWISLSFWRYLDWKF